MEPKHLLASLIGGSVLCLCGGESHSLLEAAPPTDWSSGEGEKVSSRRTSRASVASPVGVGEACRQFPDLVAKKLRCRGFCVCN